MNNQVHFHFGKKLSRRTVLRSAGVTLAIPWLSAMERTFAGQASAQPPRRFVAMTLGLGLYADNLFPESAGRNWKPTPYLESLQDIRDRFTVVSGSSHPGVSGAASARAGQRGLHGGPRGQRRYTPARPRDLRLDEGPFGAAPSSHGDLCVGPPGRRPISVDRVSGHSRPTRDGGVGFPR